ncbi:MAG: DUF3179 domain-containing protein [Rhodothermaceae bacterium]|nr:DUF3179 domain-containing protein [Rhodothermaceae bacterium]
MYQHLKPLCLLFALVLLAACDSGNDEPDEPTLDPNCIIPTSEFANSTAIDAIPALTDPKFVRAEEAGYLKDRDLVLGMQNGDLTLAVPHNILWWHEVVNLSDTSPKLAITFCPLTGSGIIFDRAAAGNVDFGVSGLLWQNNNVMFDRGGFSLWSQMGAEVLCGENTAPGTPLDAYPVVEMTWAGWKELHPETLVVGDSTGFNRNYSIDPLGDYVEPDNGTLFWPMLSPIDTRRPPKERILGIPVGEGGLSIPFMELDKRGAVAAVHAEYENTPIVVFYDREKRAAVAFDLSGSGDAQTFDAQSGQIVDLETNSTWRIDGMAVSGPLQGLRLTPIPEAYVSYWFSWAAFQPEATLWLSDSSSSSTGP